MSRGGSDELLQSAIVRLAAGRESLLPLLSVMDGPQSSWRPRPAAWSALEIANHLADEEREDFRARIEATLSDPSREWKPIDPEGWVRSRAYGDREMRPSIERFEVEREVSLTWLQSLQDVNWQATHESTTGAISAGDLLASWLAHDLFHIRQLVRLQYGYLRATLEPFDPSYAGAWGER